MPVIASFTVSTTCGCCEGEPFLVVYPCQSLTGTAQLCGYSGYSADAAPYDAGSPTTWEGQYRKWNDRTLDGDMTELSYTESGCTGDLICATSPPNAAVSFAIRYDGTASRDCAGEISQPAYDYYSDYGFGSGPCTITEGPPGETDGWSTLQPANITITKTLTLKTGEGNGCAEDTSPVQRASYDTIGTVTQELGNESQLYDALAALLAADPEGSGVVEDDLCCASTSAADLTSPESIVPINMTGTAVIRPVYVGGCEIGASVNLTVTFYRVVDGVTEYRVRTVVGACMAMNEIYFPQPAPNAPDWCWLSVVIA